MPSTSQHKQPASRQHPSPGFVAHTHASWNDTSAILLLLFVHTMRSGKEEIHSNSMPTIYCRKYYLEMIFFVVDLVSLAMAKTIRKRDRLEFLVYCAICSSREQADVCALQESLQCNFHNTLPVTTSGFSCPLRSFASSERTTHKRIENFQLKLNIFLFLRWTRYYCSFMRTKIPWRNILFDNTVYVFRIDPDVFCTSLKWYSSYYYIVDKLKRKVTKRYRFC